jgi:DNA polymerase-3 subunit gamma/tau
MSEQLMLKYRPKKWSEVIGQDHIVQTLQNGLASGDMHQTYIFSGPFGDGKTSSARILAACLNCEKFKKPTTEPCGECRTCKEIFAGVSSDIKEMNAAKERGIDDIRNLADFVAMRPLVARVKVAIIDEVHRLTPEAAESALKLFEEPPEGVVFILCTTDLQKMKVTIQSRCLPFRFSKISWMQLAELLKSIADKEGYKYEDAAIKQAAKLAKGSGRNAMNNLQLLKTFAGDNPITVEVAAKALGAVSENDYFALVDSIISKDIQSGMKILQAIFNRGQDIDTLLNGLQDHLRSLLVLTTCQNTAGLLHLNEDEKQKYVVQYAKVSINQVLKMISLMYGVSQGILVGQNPQLLLERYLVESTIACAAIEREEKAKKG